MNPGIEKLLVNGARWTNNICGECITKTLPVGTMVILNSSRPEGWMCTVKETGESFFVFNRFFN
jgi:hypothetical protein